jgi:peroxiredoxin
MRLCVGDTAPDFTANDTTGEGLTLSQVWSAGTVILAFFPKAFTIA